MRPHIMPPLCEYNLRNVDGKKQMFLNRIFSYFLHYVNNQTIIVAYMNSTHLCKTSKQSSNKRVSPPQKNTKTLNSIIESIHMHMARGELIWYSIYTIDSIHCRWNLNNFIFSFHIGMWAQWVTLFRCIAENEGLNLVEEFFFLNFISIRKAGKYLMEYLMCITGLPYNFLQ